MQLIVARAQDGGGEHGAGAVAGLDASADVHGDVGDLVVVDGDLQCAGDVAGDRHGHLEYHRVGGLHRVRQRIADPGVIASPLHEIVYVQTEPLQEVRLCQVHQVLRGGVFDGGPHRLGDPRPDLCPGLGLAGGRHDAGEREHGQVLGVAGAQFDAEVMHRELGDHLGQPCLGGRPVSVGAAAQHPALAHPVHGDGHVQQHIGGAELIDVVACRRQAADQLLPECREGIGVDVLESGGPPQRLGIQRAMDHLLVSEL